MSSVRVPIPVWFAAAAFTLLLVNPELGSANGPAASMLDTCPAADTMQSASYWQGYRTASRHWSNSNHAAAGVGAALTLVR